MTVPFMRAYTELLVRTCHRRGAHRDRRHGRADPVPQGPRGERAGASATVRADKEREAGDGFDGTWVAHPDLVPVATAAVRRASSATARTSSTASARTSRSTAAELLDVAATPGAITETGLRNNVNVGIRYISSWLRGNGAVAIHNLMEDAATAEIARSQVWQWIRHGRALEDGTPVTRELVQRLETEELEQGPGRDRRRRVVRARGPATAVARALRARGAQRPAGGVPDAAGLRAARLGPWRHPRRG